MVCAVCPGLHGVTLAGRILKLREDDHLGVTTQPLTQPFRPFNRHQRSKSSDPIPATAINRPQRSKSSDPIPDTPRHVTSPNFAPEQTSRSNAAWPMPACRAPRALRRADVEPKPYLAVACVGLTFDASVRCSRFCRAVSCHSCFLSIPARAMLSFLPCGVVPLVPVCAMLPSPCCACRCTRPARAGARARGTCCWGSP